jgi:RNA-dependent RNA polymerase
MNELGGNILQRIHLRIARAGSSKTSFEGLDFIFTLEQPTRAKSNRFSRYLGSRRLIECHFTEQDGRKYQDKLIKFFTLKKLLVNGRLFQAFYGHASKIELMEIDEDFGRTPDPAVGDLNRISLGDFIAWHNNFTQNSNQTLNKWVSRFGLGFSTSLPGLMFEPDNMHFIEDIRKLSSIPC